MNDLEIIERLNQKIPDKLKQLKKIAWFLQGYQLNDRQQVTHLSIFRMNLKGKWPEELFQLKHLEYLDIRENELETIPDSIAQLQMLKNLDMRLNQLTELPAEMSQLPCLNKLYLANNHFELVPAVVAHCPSLELIDLTNNKIASACEYLVQSQSLNQIYLNNNLVTSFPFETITRPIEELNLSENPLKKVRKHELIKNIIM